jgi:hypothetical protein
MPARVQAELAPEARSSRALISRMLCPIGLFGWTGPRAPNPFGMPRQKGPT